MVYLKGTPILYPYKFITKNNCDKIGKELSSIKKQWSYKCSEKIFPLKKEVSNANKKESSSSN